MKKRIFTLVVAFVLAIIPLSVSAATTNNLVDYMKQTSISKDGNTSVIQKSWYNPQTNDLRIDFIVPDSSSDSDNKSSYVLKNGTKLVTIIRDSDGKAIRGTYSLENSKTAKEIVESNKSLSFDSIKTQYKRSEWKKVGTVKDKSGKTLTKLSLSSSGKSMGKDIDMIEYAYIDKNTGLPTKTELYTLKKNKEVLQNTSLYEYNQVKDKTSLFDTSDVKLKKDSGAVSGVNG